MTSRVITSCGTAPETAAIGTRLHHAVRLLAGAGDFAAAYKTLDSFPLKDTEAFQRTVLRLGQYLAGTGLIEEGRNYRRLFLQSAGRQQLAELENAEDLEWQFASLSALFAADMQEWLAAMAVHPLPASDPLFNLLPQERLARLSDDSAFSEKERALFARVAWTRGYILGRDNPSLSALMLKLNPGINSVYQDIKQSHAKIDEARQWLLTVLRTPRLGILTTAESGWDMLDMTGDDAPMAVDAYDHNDKNWWCPFNTDRHLLAVRDSFDRLTGNGAAQLEDRSRYAGIWYRNDKWFRALIDPGTSNALGAAREKLLGQHPAVRLIDWKELARLRKAPSAPKLLAQRAVQWARRGGRLQDGVGEALSLSLRAARYGCNWAGSHKTYTQAAVGLLRTKFKDSHWAKETPYWYDCLWHDYPPGQRSFERKPTCRAPVWPKQRRLGS
jgi:hypothetical protein